MLFFNNIPSLLPLKKKCAGFLNHQSLCCLNQCHHNVGFVYVSEWLFFTMISWVSEKSYCYETDSCAGPLAFLVASGIVFCISWNRFLHAKIVIYTSDIIGYTVWCFESFWVLGGVFYKVLKCVRAGSVRNQCFAALTLNWSDILQLHGKG